MAAFFWVLRILAGAFIVTIAVHYLGGLLHLKRSGQWVGQKQEKEKQNQFESQCWQAKLRRETEPTGIVEHELNGHHYIAVSHGLAEVPALYLSMRRMMMEVENNTKWVIDTQDKEWSVVEKEKPLEGKTIKFVGRYTKD